MNIFYASPDQIYQQKLELRDQEAHHASHVLRYRVGDAITVVDGRGGWFEGVIQQIGDQNVMVDIENKRREEYAKPGLTLGMAIIKKRDRLEFAVEKAVELGVTRIVLFDADRSEKGRVRMDRLETIAVNAMKQSLRTYLPDLAKAPSLEEVLEVESDKGLVIAHQGREEVQRVREAMKNEKELLLLIGPEGGFTERELTLALEKSARPVSLSPKRLRAETAAVVLVSVFTELH